MPLCRDFEEKLIKHIWRTRTIARKESPSISSTSPSDSNSDENLNEKPSDITQISKEQPTSEPTQLQSPLQHKWWSWRLNPKHKNAVSKRDDPEKKQAERKLVLLGPFYAGCGAALSACKFCF